MDVEDKGDDDKGGKEEEKKLGAFCLCHNPVPQTHYSAFRVTRNSKIVFYLTHGCKSRISFCWCVVQIKECVQRVCPPHKAI